MIKHLFPLVARIRSSYLKLGVKLSGFPASEDLDVAGHLGKTRERSRVIRRNKEQAGRTKHWVAMATSKAFCLAKGT